MAAILNDVSLDNALSNDNTSIITNIILLRPPKRLSNDRILGDTIGID